MARGPGSIPTQTTKVHSHREAGTRKQSTPQPHSSNPGGSVESPKENPGDRRTDREEESAEGERNETGKNGGGATGLL